MQTQNAAPIPPLDQALRTLFRRQVRAVVWLVVRMFALAMLSAFLVRQWPWLREHRWPLDTLTGILAIAPLLRSVARNWAWRIGLGRAYLEAGRYDDTITVLRPLDTIQGELFDPTGEGRKALDAARQKTHP